VVPPLLLSKPFAHRIPILVFLYCISANVIFGASIGVKTHLLVSACVFLAMATRVTDFKVAIRDNRLSVFRFVPLEQRGCLRIFRRFRERDQCVFDYLRSLASLARAHARVRATNVRGSLIVSRTSARRIDLSHARRQIAARHSPDFASESASRENALSRGRRGWKGGDPVRELRGCARTAAPRLHLSRFFRSRLAPLSGSDVNGTNGD